MVLWGGGARTTACTPKTAKLAREHLEVQASSAASERLCSQAGLVNTDKSSRMSGETAADIIFLHESVNKRNRMSGEDGGG